MSKQLANFVPESFVTIVLYTTTTQIPGKGVEYGFMTQNNGSNTAKSPDGMFDNMVITNDLVVVEETINKFYN